MTDQIAHKAARTELLMRLIIVFVVTSLVASLILGAALLVRTSGVVTAIRGTQVTNTSVNKTNQSLLQIIHSCLTPGQPCYQQGQKQRASTAKGNARASSAAAACAVELPDPTYHAVYRCVKEHLAPKGNR